MEMDDFYDDDFMEDSFFGDDFEPEDVDNDGSGIEDDQSDETCEDEFTMEDAVMTGIAYGWGYEEGLLEERKRRRLEKNIDHEKKDRNTDSKI
jgi:hypothetical protein